MNSVYPSSFISIGGGRFLHQKPHPRYKKWHFILNILKDTEKLYHDLKRDLPNFVNIMQLPKSPGVQPRNKDQRREIRDFQIRQYFEGASLDLHPHSYDVRFSDFEIYKIGAPALPESALPIGTVREDTRTQLVKLNVCSPRSPMSNKNESLF